MKKQGLLFTFSILMTACTNQLPTGLESAQSASSTPAVRTLMVADRAMSYDQVAYQKTSAGGLIANLIVQPRASMSAPDSQVVGCGQAGDGALGIDAYVARPDWITQTVLLSGLFVPTRNFSLGFPAGDSTLPVKSYFVLDATGFFKLADGEPEGDYQFAVVADDGARLEVGNGESFTTLVDDEKPAGPNGGCLERTQSAHMSCTTAWADQSAAKVRTVHVAPGDRVPMRFRYWQGPGFGLSMMAFYRRATPNALIDPSCGQEQGFGAGEASLNALESRWSVIGAANLTNSTAN